MTAIFLAISCGIIYFQCRKEKNIINIVSILMAPYVLIVFFNNYFFVNLGYFSISDTSLTVYLIAFLLFFVGGQLAMKTKKNVITTERKTKDELDKYNIRVIKIVVTCIVVIGVGKLYYAVSTENLTEGYMSSGLVGHLLLLSYSLVPILFLYWTYNKREISCLLLSLCILALTFTTLIKYNIISLIIILFLFLTINRRSMVKKAVVVLISTVFVVFVLNYVLGFYMQGVLSNVQSSFYANHFWTYCSGGLINSNHMYAGNLSEDIGIFYKLMIYICALPNMFLSILNINFFSFDALDFSSHIISIHGLKSNVVDAITRLYPADGDILQVLLFGLFMLIIGFVFMRIYLNAKRESISVFLPIFLTYFLFLSFFGTFYMLSGPWETMVWSLLIPGLFTKSSRLRISKRSIITRP